MTSLEIAKEAFVAGWKSAGHWNENEIANHAATRYIENLPSLKKAIEQYYEMICPKCGAEFEPIPYSATGKFPYPNGVMCPECPGDIVGVIHPQLKLRIIVQGEWDALKKENEILSKHVKELVARLQITNDSLTRIYNDIDAIIKVGK